MGGAGAAVGIDGEADFGGDFFGGVVDGLGGVGVDAHGVKRGVGAHSVGPVEVLALYVFVEFGFEAPCFVEKVSEGGDWDFALRHDDAGAAKFFIGIN